MEARLSGLIGSTANPPIVEFNTVLQTLAESKLPDAPMRAERWLRYLLLHGQPDESSYANVLLTWKNAIHEEPTRVIARARQWFEKCHPKSTRVHNLYLDILTSGRSWKNARGRNTVLMTQHAETAENLLKSMVEENLANLDSFNFVIRGWNRCRRSVFASERCIHVLRLMERHNVRPDTRSYGLVMDAIANRAKLRVMQCRDPDGPDNGMEEIRVLENILESLANPNTYVHNILLNCWSNLAPLHPSAPQQAEDIISRLIAEYESTGVGPDTITFNNVIRCWARSNEPNRGDRIMYWLRKMWRDYEYNGTCMPNVETYNRAIHVWIALKRPDQAEALLQELMQLSEKHPIAPNSETFSHVIRAWLMVANEGSEGALQAAGAWMNTLLDREKQEDSSNLLFGIDLFSLYLAAARKCAPHAPWILKDVTEMLDNVEGSRHKVDSLHYARWLQVGLLALSRQKDDVQRNEFIHTVMVAVKDLGLVSAHVVRALGTGPVYDTGWTMNESDRVFKEIFPYWPIPAMWTRNVTKDLPSEEDMQRTSYQIFIHGCDPFSGQGMR